ncbi:Oidioi.mRNA.OKI2018_I69.chr2.g7070.t1.cds [Oikopleura dioica]|uniref:Oidioi.mRNA.OKI2018_I69.chr2.g7070.t1.cds n=1 Tax=Oikopleura dioica TaxID=34765 RepID=A0ABN7T7B8_OIKDI|nr:Oidioi.mRNA.OKI2018_I69.chr2.g7070.t1.cds [Oikopleura dioica]
MAAYCPAGCYCAGQGSECPLFTGNFNNWCGASCSCPQGHYCEFNDFPRPCTLGYYTECPTVRLNFDEKYSYGKKVSGTPGAKSMEDCLPCPAGTAVNLATPGYAGPENCADCQPGSYRKMDGNYIYDAGNTFCFIC